MESDPTFPSAYADGSSYVALRAIEMNKNRNFKTHASGCDDAKFSERAKNDFPLLFIENLKCLQTACGQVGRILWVPLGTDAA